MELSKSKEWNLHLEKQSAFLNANTNSNNHSNESKSYTKEYNAEQVSDLLEQNKLLIEKLTRLECHLSGKLYLISFIIVYRI